MFRLTWMELESAEYHNEKHVTHYSTSHNHYRLLSISITLYSLRYSYSSQYFFIPFVNYRLQLYTLFNTQPYSHQHGQPYNNNATTPVATTTLPVTRPIQQHSTLRSHSCHSQTRSQSSWIPHRARRVESGRVCDGVWRRIGGCEESRSVGSGWIESHRGPE